MPLTSSAAHRESAIVVVCHGKVTTERHGDRKISKKWSSAVEKVEREGFLLGLTQCPPRPSRPPCLISALHPQLRFPRPVVGSLDVPILSERVLVHSCDEVEGRLEFDVIESRF